MSAGIVTNGPLRSSSVIEYAISACEVSELSALQVPRSMRSECGKPRACWKPITARKVFFPREPSISPLENPARSSRIWARTADEPAPNGIAAEGSFTAAGSNRKALVLEAALVDAALADNAFAFAYAGSGRVGLCPNPITTAAKTITTSGLMKTPTCETRGEPDCFGELLILTRQLQGSSIRSSP